MIKKNILVACGTGIATSVQVASKLKDLLKDRGIEAMTAECKASELPSKIDSSKPDAIVANTHVSLKEGSPKVFSGIPFLTGVNDESLADEIAEYLKSIDN